MEEPELELYTIPAQSSWFVWDDIHEIERREFEEFFTESSITRTPKVYKEYRDFIINKYREDITRKLSFTGIRKHLVGDVNLLRKVFQFLENWGLINFTGSGSGSGFGFSSVKRSDDDVLLLESEVKQNVKIEDGIPNGIRVTATPNSFRPITALPVMEERAETGNKLPPLTSYSDVFVDSKKKKKTSDNELVCGNCQERCDSCFYEHNKNGFKICEKCFENGDNNSADDFKLIRKPDDDDDDDAVWSEEETLLLLESVLKHGDDWELIAQSVSTKSRVDCISKLIDLPFGEFLMGSASASGRLNSADVKTDGQEHEGTETVVEEEEDEEEPPAKRKCVDGLISDGGSSLMKQVAVMVSKVGSSVTTTAAKAAIEALCVEASCPKEIFETADYKNRDDGDKDTNIEEENDGSSRDLPAALRIRASVATALGAAAAHAKMLADQEEREMELLAATVIDQQVKKLQSKLKFLDDLELIMDAEEKVIDGLKETILQERISVLESAFRSGITKRWDHTYVK